MLHKDFIADLDRHDTVWTVRDIGAALRDGFGRRSRAYYNLALIILLLPSLLLAIYAVIAGKFLFLIWSLLAMIGFRLSSTRPTGIGMITCFLIAIAGTIIFVMKSDWLHFAGGIMPGVTWFGTCAAKGTAMTSIEQKLRASPEFLARLESAGNLESEARS